MYRLILSAAALFLSLAGAAQTVQEQAADSLLLDSLQNYDLGEVTVTAQRQLVKNDIDRLSYDVQADEDSKGSTLMDMLRKVPMVSVDGQDNIKVQGSSAFKIYRNGHPDPSLQGARAADVLKAIPANTIKKIEVITDPGAKEDAEGTTYILNIVMLDNARFGGVSGTLSSAYCFLTGTASPNAYLMTQTGKLTLSVNYGAVVLPKRSNDQGSMQDYTYTESGQHLVTTGKQDLSALVHYGSVNASYEIDSLNLLTLSGSGQAVMDRKVGSWEDSGTTTLYDRDGSLVYSYNSVGQFRNYEQSTYSGRLDFQHKTHLDGEVLTFSYMLSANRTKIAALMHFTDMQNMAFGYNGYDYDTFSRMTEHTLQLDYVRPFARYHKLEMGAKYIDRTSKSDTGREYLTDGSGTAPDDVDSRFQHNTRVGAAYAEWMFTKDKWAARAGLRYEYSYLGAKFLDGSADNFHKSLNDWVPSASVKYNFTDANSLKLSFSTSINRPGISYLNPARNETPQDLSYGNSDLNSGRVQKVQLNFAHVGAKVTWNVTPYVNWTRNQIGVVRFVNDKSQWVTTYSGVEHDTWFGLSGNVQWQPWKGTQLVLNAVYYRDIISNRAIHTTLAPNGYSLAKWSGYFHANLSQKLFWGMNLGVGVGSNIGHSPNNVYELEGNWDYHYFSLQKSFLKDDRLTVQLLASNIFYAHKQKNSDTRIVQGDYTGVSRWSDYNSRDFSIRVSWRFGKLKASVKSVDTTIENNDLKGGAGGGLGGGSNSGGK